MTTETSEKPLISFNNVIIIAFIFLVGYISVLLILKNESAMIFSDLISPIIGILAAFSLFYVAKISGKQQRRVQIAWIILGVSVLFFVIGDITWGIMELIIHQEPFPSVADFFYLSFYPLFALGIYYLPWVSLSGNEKLKLVIDTAILIITFGLILWIFLVIPTLNSNDALLGSIISIAYIIGDIVLLFALIRILFNNFKNTYCGPLILLGTGIIAQIVTDTVFSYQSLHGTYSTGGLLDTGWVLCFIFIGLAAILQTYNIKYGQGPYIKLGSWIQNFSFPSHSPLLGVAVAYILLLWTNNNLTGQDSMYIWIGVGVTVALVLLRQLITLNENRGLYLAAKNEIENRKMVEKDLVESKNHFKNIFDNAPVGIFHSSPEGKLYGVNQNLSDILGYNSPEEFTSMVNKSSIGEQVYVNKEERLEIVKETINDDQWHTYECRFYQKYGSIIIAELSIKAVKDSDGSVKYLEGFVNDITERKKNEKALQESEKKYRDLAELLPQPVFEFDLYGNVTYANSTGQKIFGYTQKDLDKGLNMLQILAAEDHNKVMKDTQRVLNGEKLAVGEYTAQKKDDTTFPIIIYSSPIIHENKIIGSRGVVVDITLIKKAENEIKASLNEKELLLKEIHHRVKNNMQIISSLLNLQLSYVDDNQGLEILKESQGRIKSMALVHENIYLSKTLASINFKDYIQKLAIDLIVTYNAQCIDLKLNVEDIDLNIETAIPCGLIINELITNSIKHAFKEINGTIIVEFRRNKDKFILTVSDNGIGISESLDSANSASLGLQLVQMLVKQLDGKMNICSDGGTVFTITFKELDYKKRV